MDDLVILKHAKSYIDQLAKGIDPLSGEKVPANQVLSQERLLKCFAYVSTVLESVVEEKQQKKEEEAKKMEVIQEKREESVVTVEKNQQVVETQPEVLANQSPTSEPEHDPNLPPVDFAITAEQQVKVPISDDPVKLSSFCQTITEVVNHKNMRPLEEETVVEWLICQGYLTCEEETSPKKTVATEKGTEIGIETIGGLLPFSSKTVTTYHTKAQHFILEHLPQILSP